MDTKILSCVGSHHPPIFLPLPAAKQTFVPPLAKSIALLASTWAMSRSCSTVVSYLFTKEQYRVVEVHYPKKVLIKGEEACCRIGEVVQLSEEVV